eukprot:GHVS01060966.1.p1 GENE.GHVS01060966.1~~GHVS01060966.1.p1  ORF type:complete len:215 (+),score=21.63 GHVS01060966.1:110-754(+)
MAVSVKFLGITIAVLSMALGVYAFTPKTENINNNYWYFKATGSADTTLPANLNSALNTPGGPTSGGTAVADTAWLAEVDSTDAKIIRVRWQYNNEAGDSPAIASENALAANFNATLAQLTALLSTPVVGAGGETPAAGEVPAASIDVTYTPQLNSQEQSVFKTGAPLENINADMTTEFLAGFQEDAFSGVFGLSRPNLLWVVGLALAGGYLAMN